VSDPGIGPLAGTGSENPELLCYCKTWTRAQFAEYSRANADASFDEVCLGSGVGMVCTSCLLNAELIFTEARRAGPAGGGGTGGAGAKRQKLRWPTKGEMVDWLVRHSPLVPGRFESVSPIIAGPGLTTVLHVSNAFPAPIGPKSAKFRVEVECRDADGHLVEEFAEEVSSGHTLSRDLSASLPGEALRCGGARVTLVAQDRRYKGTVRPHFVLWARQSVSAVHTANASRGQTTPHIFSRRCADERHFIYVRNAESVAIDAEIETEALDGSTTERQSRRLPPFGSALIELTAHSNAPAGALYVTRLKAGGLQRSYFVCATRDLAQVSADHV
jgi:hypothetical protein